MCIQGREEERFREEGENTNSKGGRGETGPIKTREEEDTAKKTGEKREK